jgi:thymidylate synthase (FAD)
METQSLETQVLDKGFVRLIDFMGGDVAVVQAARVSLGETTKGEAKDKKLVDYLLQNKHETPFEQSVFKFHIKCPIFVARQWFRHRMASYNEISGRYTQMKEEFFLPEILRRQKLKNYEYEDIDNTDASELINDIDNCYTECYLVYRKLLDNNVAKEQARIVLPLALYTQFYWTINARALMNFLSLRVERHAQSEIRQYADAILVMFKKKMPWTCEAFERYYLL